MSLFFKQDELDKGTAYFKKLHVTNVQQKLISDVARVISKFTGIDLLPMKGFLLMTIKDWQVANKKEFTELAFAPDEERIPAEEDLMKRLFIRMSKLLKDENDIQKLRDAIGQSYEFYKIQYDRE
ncbi:MAG: hypothetical protein INQ03_10385 [Candidatus Heimdallarchaeota archaeon]|nr:hypothetical protein [Candidatus Heimdallarchaeota archaeon]